MTALSRRATAPLLAAFALAAASCSHAPLPSHAGDAYRGKLTDDTLVEASSTVLITTKDVVVALDCGTLRQALERDDSAAVDRAVAAGSAVRLPAGVTLYTPPFGADNPGTMPLVVTDDRAAGRLCTPGSYTVARS
ncbi:MAG TPA: hypothetical protein VGF86_00170 [Candidatus Tumulicola sp.]